MVPPIPGKKKSHVAAAEGGPTTDRAIDLWAAGDGAGAGMDSRGGDGTGTDSGGGGESTGAVAAEGPKNEPSREVGGVEGLGIEAVSERKARGDAGSQFRRVEEGRPRRGGSRGWEKRSLRGMGPKGWGGVAYLCRPGRRSIAHWPHRLSNPEMRGWRCGLVHKARARGGGGGQ